MGDEAEIECPKCKEGSLTCIYKSCGFSYDTDWGTEWDVQEWVEILSQSCECSFSHKEHEEISNLTMNKIEQRFRENVIVQELFDDGV